MILLLVPRFIISMDFPVADDAFLKQNKIDPRLARAARLADIRDPLHKDPAIEEFLRDPQKNGFELFHAQHGILKNPTEAELQLLIPHLIRAGYNPSLVIDDRGSHLLHYAVSSRFAFAVEALIGRAHVNSQDMNGDTPLHSAIRLGLPHIVEILLQRGDVNLQLPNNVQQTVLTLVKDDYKIRPLLEGYAINHPSSMVVPTAQCMDSTAFDHELALALAGGDSDLMDGRGRPHPNAGHQLYALANRIIKHGQPNNNGLGQNPPSNPLTDFCQRIKEALPHRTFLTFAGGLLTLPVTLLIRRLLKSVTIEIPLFRKKRAVQVVK
jgi:hypothetical protein